MKQNPELSDIFTGVDTWELQVESETTLLLTSLSEGPPSLEELTQILQGLDDPFVREVAQQWQPEERPALITQLTNEFAEGLSDVDEWLRVTSLLEQLNPTMRACFAGMKGDMDREMENHLAAKFKEEIKSNELSDLINSFNAIDRLPAALAARLPESANATAFREKVVSQINAELDEGRIDAVWQQIAGNEELPTIFRSFNPENLETLYTEFLVALGNPSSLEEYTENAEKAQTLKRKLTEINDRFGSSPTAELEYLPTLDAVISQVQASLPEYPKTWDQHQLILDRLQALPEAIQSKVKYEPKLSEALTQEIKRRFEELEPTVAVFREKNAELQEITRAFPDSFLQLELRATMALFAKEVVKPLQERLNNETISWSLLQEVSQAPAEIKMDLSYLTAVSLGSCFEKLPPIAESYMGFVETCDKLEIAEKLNKPRMAELVLKNNLNPTLSPLERGKELAVIVDTFPDELQTVVKELALFKREEESLKTALNQKLTALDQASFERYIERASELESYISDFPNQELKTEVRERIIAQTGERVGRLEANASSIPMIRKLLTVGDGNLTIAILNSESGPMIAQKLAEIASNMPARKSTLAMITSVTPLENPAADEKLKELLNNQQLYIAIRLGVIRQLSGELTAQSETRGDTIEGLKETWQHVMFEQNQTEGMGLESILHKAFFEQAERVILVELQKEPPDLGQLQDLRQFISEIQENFTWGLPEYLDNKVYGLGYRINRIISHALTSVPPGDLDLAIEAWEEVTGGEKYSITDNVELSLFTTPFLQAARRLSAERGRELPAGEEGLRQLAALEASLPTAFVAEETLAEVRASKLEEYGREIAPIVQNRESFPATLEGFSQAEAYLKGLEFPEVATSSAVAKVIERLAEEVMQPQIEAFSGVTDSNSYESLLDGLKELPPYLQSLPKVTSARKKAVERVALSLGAELSKTAPDQILSRLSENHPDIQSAVVNSEHSPELERALNNLAETIRNTETSSLNEALSLYSSQGASKKLWLRANGALFRSASLFNPEWKLSRSNLAELITIIDMRGGFLPDLDFNYQALAVLPALPAATLSTEESNRRIAGMPRLMRRFLASESSRNELFLIFRDKGSELVDRDSAPASREALTATEKAKLQEGIDSITGFVLGTSRRYRNDRDLQADETFMSNMRLMLTAVLDKLDDPAVPLNKKAEALRMLSEAGFHCAGGNINSTFDAFDLLASSTGEETVEVKLHRALERNRLNIIDGYMQYGARGSDPVHAKFNFIKAMGNSVGLRFGAVIAGWDDHFAGAGRRFTPEQAMREWHRFYGVDNMVACLRRQMPAEVTQQMPVSWKPEDLRAALTDEWSRIAPTHPLFEALRPSTKEKILDAQKKLHACSKARRDLVSARGLSEEEAQARPAKLEELQTELGKLRAILDEASSVGFEECLASMNGSSEQQKLDSFLQRVVSELSPADLGLYDPREYSEDEKISEFMAAFTAGTAEPEESDYLLFLWTHGAIMAP